jgi:hypothetical protein
LDNPFLFSDDELLKRKEAAIKIDGVYIAVSYNR